MVNLISSGPILEGSHGGQSLWMLLGSERHDTQSSSKPGMRARFSDFFLAKSLLSPCSPCRVIFHDVSSRFFSVAEIWTSEKRSAELLGVSRVVARRCFEQKKITQLSASYKYLN